MNEPTDAQEIGFSPEPQPEPEPEPQPGVGYGRPPPEHQFKPGNPGRPRGSRNKPKTLAEELEAALEEAIAFTTDGESVTARKAIIRKMVREAVTGEAKTTQGAVKIFDVIEARQRRWKKETVLSDDPVADILSAALRKNGFFEDEPE